MSKAIVVDGYSIVVEDRKLVIRRPDLNESINIIFSPLEASQLAVMLNKLVPDDYGVRSDFRIPVTSDLGLQSFVLVNGVEHMIETSSLSLSGMYAQTAQPLHTATGAVCQIRFQFENLESKQDAVITRSLMTGIGAAFTDSDTSDDHSRLVMAVQRKWIAKKSS